VTLAFVPNVDAEFELADPGYRRSERMHGHVQRLARALRPMLEAAFGTDVWMVGVDTGRPPPDASGIAWCLTARAAEALAGVGIEVSAGPPDEVLRRVNHRAFGAALGPLLPGAGFATDVEAVDRILAGAPDRPWLLKRPLGFSGRMRKVVLPARMDRATRTWIDASMRGYGCGLMVEPVVERLLDVSLHGRLDPRGRMTERGRPVVVVNADDGSFVAARPAADGELGGEERDVLEATLERVAGALVAQGYHGPFGIDAFRWRDTQGELGFHPLVEINARSTFGYWVGVHGVAAMRVDP
jgi:hypothetical protein